MKDKDELQITHSDELYITHFYGYDGDEPWTWFEAERGSRVRRQITIMIISIVMGFVLSRIMVVLLL